MAPKILGISSSPIPDSNTDRAVREVLKSTGLETQFIKLSSLRIEPCRACLGCLKTNQCVLDDDGRNLAQLFMDAPAFILGCYTPYSSLDARAKAFMERMYCLRHLRGLCRGKIGASVITSACPPGTANLPPAAETASSQIAFWMMEEGMINLGSLVVPGNVPCIKCGHGDSCEMSAVRMLHGPEATVASTGVHSFEADSQLGDRARALGRKIRESVGN